MNPKPSKQPAGAKGRLHELAVRIQEDLPSEYELRTNLLLDSMV